MNKVTLQPGQQVAPGDRCINGQIVGDIKVGDKVIKVPLEFTNTPKNLHYLTTLNRNIALCGFEAEEQADIEDSDPDQIDIEEIESVQ